MCLSRLNRNLILALLSLGCAFVPAWAQDTSKDAAVDDVLKQFEAAQHGTLQDSQQIDQPQVPASVKPAAIPLEQPVPIQAQTPVEVPMVAAAKPGDKIVLDALELRDMDINDVLKLIASKTGLNIIAGKNVAGRVTIFLQNVEVHDALHIILEANDLAYVESRGIIQILQAADFERIYGYKFGQLTASKVIVLKGIKAVDAAALLTQMKSAAGKVVSDEQSNTLMLEDLPAKLKDMEEYLKTVDAPTQMKMFELKNVGADAMSERIKEVLTPKLGGIRVDGPSNKIFVTDTLKKMSAITTLISQLDVPRKTEVFDLSYAKVEDVVKTVTPMVTKDLGHIESDVRSNKMVVTDIAPKIEEIRRVVNALDHQEKEVIIEARIVQVTLTDKLKMGIDWESIVHNANGLQFANDFSLGSSVSPKGVIKMGTLNDADYKIAIEALNSMGKTRVLSNPQIAVVNNQEAKILVGTTKPYVTTTTTTPATGPTTTAETVSFIDVGVKLYVTPTIHNDGYITMKIKPEVSTAANSIITGEKNEIPIVDTSTVDTIIRVKDGVTIIIGGLIKDERHNIQNKVPILGSIPLLGRAFRNEDHLTDKTEIVIFLTPHIINGDARVDPEAIPSLKADRLY